MVRRIAIWVTFAIGGLGAASCGSGLITGIVSGSDSRRPPAPSVTLFSSVLPLVPSAGTSTTIGIDNVDLTPAAAVRVVLTARGVAVDQDDLVVSNQGSSRSITFTLDTEAIRQTITDPTAADEPATLQVFRGTAALTDPVQVLLARQPRARLVDPESLQFLDTPQFLSPRGQAVSLLVEGLVATQPAQVQVVVHVPDPTPPAAGGQRGRISRLATGVDLSPVTNGLVTAFLPGNEFPVQAELEVVDAIAGVSTPVRNAFYRPQIDLVAPAQGPTTGSGEPLLIGAALVPRDFTGVGTATLRYERVFVSFAKGGRTLELPRTDLLVGESTGDQLRFRMPSSPDGRPGRVDIVLGVELDGVDAEGNLSQVRVTVTASEVFLLTNPDPFFGPRGTVLERSPVAVAPILLDSAQTTPPPAGSEAAVDFIALTEVGGVAHLQLLLAQGNGMFQRFAAPRQIGNHEQPAERGPSDVCVGDFNRDRVPDVFVVNQGAATAVHQVVLGQVRPLPPLGAVYGVQAAGGSTRARVGDFDRDGADDVLLIPGPNAALLQRPHVLLSRTPVAGQPVFAAPVDVPVASFPYEAVEVADLDGDGFVDIAVVNGSTGRLDVAYGDGLGTFPTVESLTIGEPELQSKAVSLHACRDVPHQSLALVVAGGELSPPPGSVPVPAPAVAVLRQLTPRQYTAPSENNIVSVTLSNVTASLVDDFDQDSAGQLEMLVAFRSGTAVEMLLLQLVRQNQQAVVFAPGGTLLPGSESAGQIRSLWFGRAFPRNPGPTGSPGALAVFVVHETEVDGVTERRLSTRLIQPQPELEVQPAAGGGSIQPGFEDLVAGNFVTVGPAYVGPVRNLALLQTGPGQSDQILLIENDGVGGFPGEGDALSYAGLLPGSAVSVPSGVLPRDRLLFGGRDSRFGVWDPGETSGPQLRVSSPLRLASSDPLLQSRDLAIGTKAVVGDVDGDGIDDAVVLLAFGLIGEGQSALALLRGKAVVAPNEFPFHEPSQLTPVHGRATALVLGDFAAAGTGQPVRLELAVAVPEGTVVGGVDGNHVRFFRYQAGAVPAEDRFVPGAAAGGPQVLLAGDGPAALAAADFDRDGSVDLLVACGGAFELQLYRNKAGPAAGGGVVVSAFELVSGSRPRLDPGMPRRLQLGDINGDGSLDAIVGVEFTAPMTGLRSSTIAFYLGSGAGGFSDKESVSPSRLGQRGDRVVFDLGDWNSDQVVDLLVGWNTVNPPTTDFNLRVLFGGTR